MPLPAHIEALVENLAGHQQYDHGIGSDEIVINQRVDTDGQRVPFVASVTRDFPGRFSSEGLMVPGQPAQSVDNLTGKIAQLLQSPDTIGFIKPRQNGQKYDIAFYVATDSATGKMYQIVLNPNDPVNGGSMRRIKPGDKSFDRISNRQLHSWMLKVSIYIHKLPAENMCRSKVDTKILPIKPARSAYQKIYLLCHPIN